MTDEPTRPLDDETLLAAVGDMLAETEPLRSDLVDVVSTEAFAMRSIDALMAELVHDTAASAGGTRAEESFRTISFAAHGVDIEVRFGSDGRTVHGWIDPPDARCTMDDAVEGRPLTLDEFGRFTAATGSGRLRFVITLPDGRSIATPWIFR